MRVFLLLIPGLLLGGCADFGYYSQALAGQWELITVSRPLADVLHDPATAVPLRHRLELAGELRDFAVQELKLPDNGSYRRYADLRRPFVIRNVFAAPELSLEPHEWCFPIAGCVSYRGYFDAAAAEQTAATLKTKGYDVYVGNVPAYSTLGWFDDPLLNTFVYWPSGRLAELVFHELAHQRLYFAGATEFNESFATFVGQLGAQRWLAQQGTPAERAEYKAAQCAQDTLLTLALAAKAELAALYASDQSPSAKRAGKARIFAALQARYEQTTPTDDSRWFADMNNAKLAALNAYTQYVPAFTVLFAQAGEDMERFYQAVAALGHLPDAERRTRLAALLATPRLNSAQHAETHCNETTLPPAPTDNPA